MYSSSVVFLAIKNMNTYVLTIFIFSLTSFSDCYYLTLLPYYGAHKAPEGKYRDKQLLFQKIEYKEGPTSPRVMTKQDYLLQSYKINKNVK